jgi:NADPH:quinone reductase
MPPLPAGQRVVISAFGQDPLDAIQHHLSIEPQLPPDPAQLKPSDVIIAVKSASVGWVDLLMTSGQYQHMPSPPYTPGLEYSGVIAWAGPEVDTARLPVGAAVLADGLLTGPRSWGDYQAYGGFASYAVAPQAAVHPLPKGMSFDEGCNLLGNYETAYHALIACGELKPSDTVLILGASGATGLAAVHIAKLLGARVIATGRSPEKLAQLLTHGADHVICTSAAGAGEAATGLSLRDQVKALTEGQGVSVIYDPVGGELSAESMRCAAFGARFLIVGWAATPFVAQGRGQRGAPNVNMLPTNLMMMKGLKVLGCPAVISTYHDPSLRPARLQQLWRWVEADLIHPCVSRVFPMAQIREAMLAKWHNSDIGGCVVHPEGEV